VRITRSDSDSLIEHLRGQGRVSKLAAQAGAPLPHTAVALERQRIERACGNALNLGDAGQPKRR
jgi:hypothetical protein